MKPLSRLDELDQAALVRPLSPDESREIDRLLALEYQRRWRLPGQIENAKARWERLVARLPPAEQLRLLRAEARAAWERLHQIEEALEPGARLARIVKELGR